MERTAREKGSIKRTRRGVSFRLEVRFERNPNGIPHEETQGQRKVR